MRLFLPSFVYLLLYLIILSFFFVCLLVVPVNDKEDFVCLQTILTGSFLLSSVFIYYNPSFSPLMVSSYSLIFPFSVNLIIKTRSFNLLNQVNLLE